MALRPRAHAQPTEHTGQQAPGPTASSITRKCDRGFQLVYHLSALKALAELTERGDPGSDMEKSLYFWVKNDLGFPGSQAILIHRVDYAGVWLLNLCL